MEAHEVLLAVGGALIAASLVLAGVAAWLYRALDIRGVRDDLSGLVRVREIASARREDDRGSAARPPSGASRGRVARGEPPPDAAGDPGGPTTQWGAGEGASGGLRRGAGDDEETLFDGGLADAWPCAPLGFHVTRGDMGVGSPRGIEE